MNQILDYNPNKGSGGKSSGSDNLVRVFAFFLIIFAIGLIVVASVSLLKNRKQENQPIDTPVQATITTEQTDDKVILKITHDKVIDSYVCKWDTGKEVTKNGGGKSAIEDSIELLKGEHVLNVKVIDIDGVESSYQETFTSENGVDSTYPEVELKLTEKSKLKIIATDDTELSFVTYRWNDDEEIRVDVEDDPKKIEFEIDILKGRNNFTVIAVDTNNNTARQSESFTGLTNPEIEINVSADKKKAEVVCKHENGIKEITVNMNGQDFNVELPEENQKEVTIPLEFTEEKTELTVRVVSVTDTEKIAKEEIIQENNDKIECNLEVDSSDESQVLIDIKAESGLKEISITQNEQVFTVELPEEGMKDVSVPLPLAAGDNNIKVTIKSASGLEKEFEKVFTK